LTPSWRHAVRLVSLAAVAATVLSACSSMGLGPTVKRGAFTSKEYGVNASPRVTNDPNPPRGGGRYMVGKPYVVRGTTFVPQENPVGYAGLGKGSWYGADFHGRLTANGEIFSANAITGAHPTLPLPCYVRVTNTENGRTLMVRVNDRGPYLPGRVMDLSYRAAAMLGYVDKGSAQIQVEYMGKAPLEGDDTRMLVASYQGPSDFGNHTQVATAGGTNSLADIAGNFFGGMFSYADGGAPGQDASISSAQSAADALAAQSPDLDLGSYTDPSQAAVIAQEFALLGAVDQTETTLAGAPAIRLTLTHYKPGATRVDAVNLAAQLGLDDVVLY
jgi:rare lipoprotein A